MAGSCHNPDIQYKSLLVVKVLDYRSWAGLWSETFATQSEPLIFRDIPLAECLEPIRLLFQVLRVDMDKAYILLFFVLFRQYFTA